MKRIILILSCFFTSFALFAQQNSVLVFSKTEGFRHSSIKEGQDFFKSLAAKSGFKLVLSENSQDFNELNLKKYNAVVFLNTTGDILDQNQQIEFERYIQSGGGYMGIHASTDCEYGWNWYNDLVGAYFLSHPGGEVSNVQKGTMTVLDKMHPSTAHMPETFDRTDEFYDFKSLKTDKLKFLIKLDEKSYKMGKMGDFHPMAWHHEFDGGKSFYTNFGHTPETFSEPLMTKHFEEGLKFVWAKKLDFSKAKSIKAPEENRFSKTSLMRNLDEPTELAIMPNGKVILVERKGAIKIWNPKTNQSKKVGQLNVYTKFEYGLMGVGIDPNFEKNNWIYMYYTPDTEQHKDQFLSRFTYDQKADTILYDTEKVVLRVPVKRVECCHTGGSIDWDNEGNLFLSTGDDTNPFASDGFAPIDFRTDRQGWDALSSAGNTNDLRGKILKIKPNDDGTYRIPKGNLFPEGLEKTKPEIFVMGNRNPYRISVDKTTNYLYWGEVGPDAGKTLPERGPEGFVEFNQAKKAGNYGWPLFMGNNAAYNEYNFDTKSSGPKYDPKKPINNSTHNTGLKNLPPTQKPLVWYGYGVSSEFPLLGKGGANPMGGPVYHSSEFKDNPNKFPAYFDNKFFAYEWMRDWIILISLDKNGNYAGMEKFMPNSKFYHPIDMSFNANGELYVLEYGMNWFAQNEEASLTKIDYNSGNRKPLAKAASNITNGAAPLSVKFSSAGTVDYDNDKIAYNWAFGKGIPNSKLANPVINFTKPGEYEVTLTVTDVKGNSSKENLKIKVGNSIPEVDIVVKTNKSFFFDDKIDYEVNIKDKEDGTINKGINTEDVIVSINYLEGFDKTILEQGHKSNETFATGRRLIELSDCAACHSRDKKSIGPSYNDIAGKYKRSNANVEMLAKKIMSGGGGVWGEQAMAAHPQLSKNEARDMADYILSINDTKKVSKPISGVYSLADHKDKKEGAYIIRASYTDRGGKVIGPISNSKSIALKSPIIKFNTYDKAEGTQKFSVPQLGELVIVSNDSYIQFDAIDLMGITKLSIGAFGQAGQTIGGKLEIRSNSLTGPIIGEADIPDASMKPIEIILKNIPQKPENIVFMFKNTTGNKPIIGLTSLEFKR